MASIIFSDEYAILPALMVEHRRRAGLTQRALADRIRRSQSHVYKMETGQRRIELIEFCRYIEAAGGDPVDALAGLLDRLQPALAQATVA
ncbi:MAG: helix-turn-helix transcriptional regulator [Proteobacteria bacterium]|nr:helix-turn-helix transcriptional regulator [Pseudomonadota bacterium]